MNGAQALFKALVDAGLDTCFANPGTSEMQLVAEIGRTEGVRPILCLQENVVTGAADGYGRMAGKPAFTLLHVGSGFANGVANIHNASRGNTTMVNIVGCNATYHQPNFPEHEFINGKVVDLARLVSHWAHEAKSASDLAVLGALATRYARIGAGKICTVIAPTNCHWDPAVAPPVPAGPMETPKASPQTIQEVVAQLTNGKKTAIVLGSLALHNDGLELAGRIAAKTGADLLGETTASRFARGEGRVPVELIPYFPEDAIPFLNKYEQLILVGALYPVATFAYHNKPVVKVPPGCEVTTLATVDHDILAALSDLAKAVGAPAQPATRQARTKGAMPAEGADRSGHWSERVYIAAGERDHCLRSHHNGRGNLCPHPRSQGSRFPAWVSWRRHRWRPTVGARSRNRMPGPEDRVFEGDGCGMYTVQALWSMAREQANVTVVVMKNDIYGVLNIELARAREGDANDKMESMLRLDNPSIDWVKISEAQGVPASRATTAEEFHKQFEAAMGTKGPHLIEANIVQNLQPVIDAVHKNRG